MIVIGLDPGPEESALVSWNGFYIIDMFIKPNDAILFNLQTRHKGDPLVIEKVTSFGMPVGSEVFETVFWSGRFAQAYGIDNTHRLSRIDVKTYLCHSAKAKDANVRQAILDKFGGRAKAIGKKPNYGPLHGVSSHMWSALALAITWHDQHSTESTVSTERHTDVRQ